MTNQAGEGSIFRPVAGWLVLAGILFCGWLLVKNDFYLRLMMLAGIFIIAVLPFDLMTGYMGYLSMGQAAFFGTGAYIIGNLTALRFNLDFWLALPVAVIFIALLAYLISFPLFRLRGVHFAIGTLAVGQLSWLVFNSWDWFSGATFGINGIARPAIGGLKFQTNSQFYLLVSGFVFLSALVSWLIARGMIGRALKAIRQDEDLAAARGLDVLRYKRFIFVVAAVFAGIGGALYAPMQIVIDPSSFTIWTSFKFVIFAILGGTGTLIGPVIGVIFITILDQVIQEFGQWNQLVLGLLLLLIILFFRGGLLGVIQTLARPLGKLMPKR